MKDRGNIIDLLNSKDSDELKALIDDTESIRRQKIGSKIYLRGLIEFSNYCDRDCLYCGVRNSNSRVVRYKMDQNEIIAIIKSAYQQGYRSVCLQSGELDSTAQINWLTDIVKSIKDISSGTDKQGIGITLCVGELNYRQYLKLWEAGAHRYLLRIESSDRDLFNKLHPPAQRYEKRIECLEALKDIGFQVGTGVMIGLPGQNAEHLTRDLEFFQALDVDMLGMGPYIPHSDAPLSRTKVRSILDPYTTTLKMIALARSLMPEINMVASTALQTIDPQGLKMGIKAGANIVMPVLTPPRYRDQYLLYKEKKHTALQTIESELEEIGYQVKHDQWGDSAHYFRRLGRDCPNG